MTGGAAIVASARGVSVERDRRAVLSGVDIEVRAGEVTVLIGPNGAGKSTLLGALAGDLPPTTGEIEIFGHSVAELPLAELACLRSVMPQHHEVAFGFTVAEVVAMGRWPWQARRAPHDAPRGTLNDGPPTTVDDDARVVAGAMREADVAHLHARSARTLSGGERARVALARTLAQRAPLMLLDEPTASLDVAHQEAVLAVARARAASGVAVVVVLHDLSLAAAHADRLVLLDRGRVRASGPTPDVLRADLLGEVYGCAIDVLAHPDHGAPIVVARRTTRSTSRC